MTGRMLTGAVLLVWAGLLVGGSFIAAPAKFQVQELPLQLALQVGKAQFLWLSAGELLLGLIALALAAVCRPSKWMLLFIPVGIFALQQLVVMPMLTPRTDAIISGTAIGRSNLHLIYILLEIGKLLTLAGVATFMLGTGESNLNTGTTRDRRIPNGYEQQSETPVYDAGSVPKGLLKDHNLKAGSFGRLTVLDGSVVYFLSEHDAPFTIVRPAQPFVILPEEKHYIRVSENARFKVAFFRKTAAPQR